MGSGGKRPGAGRPKGTKAEKPDTIIPDTTEMTMAPLDFMLMVMNDVTASPSLRIRMAIAAAPFVHLRKGVVGTGKKAQRQERAKKAGSGKFASSAPPTPPDLKRIK